MSYAAPLAKWISVLLSLIYFSTSLPFNQPTSAEPNNKFAGRHGWRDQIEIKYPTLSRYATLLALQAKLDTPTRLEALAVSAPLQLTNAVDTLSVFPLSNGEESEALAFLQPKPE